MNGFDKLGSALKALVAKVTGNTRKTNPNHAAIASAIDNVGQAADDAITLYRDSEDTFTQVAELLKSGKMKLSDPKIAQAYRDYLAGAQVNKSMFFKSLIKAMETISVDMAVLDTGFSKVFGDLKTADDLRVAHGYAFGYMTLAQKTVGFFNRFVFMINAEHGDRAPAYIPAAVAEDAHAVGAFVAMLDRLGSHQSIVDDVIKIRKSGTDFLLQVDGKTLNEYAQPKDFLPKVSATLAQGLTLNPSMWVVDALLEHERAVYEKRVKMKEWMATKIAILEMDLAGISPSSPEYKQKQKVLTAYTKMITQLDQKIRAYETE